jgi:hypothetical protein
MKIRPSITFITILYFSLINGMITRAQTRELGLGFHYIYRQGAVLDRDYYDYENLRSTITRREIKGSLKGWGGQFVYSHLLKELNANTSFGIQTGLTIFFGMEVASLEPIAAYQVPVYASIRYGNGANNETEKKWGAGLGLGGMLTGFIMPDENGIAMLPALMLELKYKRCGIRMEYLLQHYKSYYTGRLGPIPKLDTGFMQVYLTKQVGR